MFEPGQIRVTQVSRQPLVSIDLLGQQLEPAPFLIVLPAFCGLAEHKLVELIPPWLVPLDEPSRRRHPGARRASYEPLLLVDDVTKRTILATRTIRASARSFAFHTGRRKLSCIFNLCTEVASSVLPQESRARPFHYLPSMRLVRVRETYAADGS